MSFAVIFPYLRMKDLRETFRDVLESPSDCSVGRRVLVFGVLYNLFTEFASYPELDSR
jgi:hypothetical protein